MEPRCCSHVFCCSTVQRGRRSFSPREQIPPLSWAWITLRGLLQQQVCPGALPATLGLPCHAERGRSTCAGTCVHTWRPCTRTGPPASTQITEAVTSWHFCIGETEKQHVILTALTWQCQRSPDTSQPCTKCACYQKTSSVVKFLHSYIPTSRVLNLSSSPSTPFISASSPHPWHKSSAAGEPWPSPAKPSRQAASEPDSARLLDVIRQLEAAENVMAAP